MIMVASPDLKTPELDRRIGDVILEVQNISLRFGGINALSNISFDVREHEIRAIIGPNGAGKSSMLNCINGVYRPSEGNITFRGRTFSNMNSHQAAKMGIARTFQNLALFQGMSVLDNIMTGRNLKIKSNLFWQALRIGPAEREEIQQREFVEHIIDFLEIEAHRRTIVSQLPYGLQKRVDLGRALAMEPSVLLLDEPMAGMGQEDVERTSALIKGVSANRTILMVEHNLSVVSSLSDTITVLARGRVLAEGDYQAVSKDPRVIEAYIGAAHG